jgi:site-specific DNA-methyltransferase (adenine-specific)
VSSNQQPAANSQQSTENSQRLTVRLEQTDCLAFLCSLPDDGVDVIVTDPAYSGMNEWLKLGNGRIVGQYADKGTEEGKWFQEFQDSEANYHSFLNECRRVLNPDTGHIYIMFDSYSLLSLGPLVRDYFAVKNLITWDKLHIGMGHYFRRRHEYVIFATNGNNRKLRHQRFPDVWRFKRLHRAPYATQKPVELFQAMIHASAEPGFTVCDPFMGSGSSAIAALKNGCHYLGCDIAADAVSLAQERVVAYQETGQDILQPKSACLPDEKVFWE